MSQMDNPFAEERCRTVFEIGKGVSWLFLVCFMLLLALPALLHNLSLVVQGKAKETPVAELFSWRPGQKEITHHLRAVEKELDEAWYSTRPRQFTQALLLSQAYEGNLKTLIGWDGWLFYHPDLKALSGYGPLKPEPFSVMKDPEMGRLTDTKDLIAEYAAQLKERGISLLLVPVPLKPMIYNEAVSPQSPYSWVTHPDAPAFYEVLRKSGVDVLDLTAELSKLRGERKHVFYLEANSDNREIAKQTEENLKLRKDVFLKQDTHWNPDGMRFVAEKVAEHVKARYPEAIQPAEEEIRAVDGVHRKSYGDLVNLLDLHHPGKLFAPEDAFLTVIGEGTMSKSSPLVLLGDSFVNVFDDPTLGFGDPAKPNERIRAGFAQHLSLLLQQPLDVVAMNGKGATGVRQEFANRPDNEVREKKLVVWVIAARDLLLSKTVAHLSNIDWGPVRFSTQTSTGSTADPLAAKMSAEVVVEVKLAEKSPNQDPHGTPYTNALHTALYDVEKVLSGTYADSQVLGVQWTFKEKVMQPTSSFAVGRRYRLTLVPWDTKKDKDPSLAGLNLNDETTAFDATRWWVEKAEAIK